MLTYIYLHVRLNKYIIVLSIGNIIDKNSSINLIIHYLEGKCNINFLLDS